MGRQPSLNLLLLTNTQMGRMEAKGKMDRKTGQVTRAGKVSHEMMRQWVSRARVELRGAGQDESPHCYKRLDDVLTEHGDSVRICIR
jgi:tRNA-splicing ligase RtcB